MQSEFLHGHDGDDFNPGNQNGEEVGGSPRG